MVAESILWYCPPVRTDSGPVLERQLMNAIVVLGMQWGDEGKGKVVDLLCPAFDLVARFQGGDNAGHTVKFEDRSFALHLVPSGILHEGKRCLLGNGMVVNPESLIAEIDYLEEAGVEVGDRFMISRRAQANLPLFGELDRAREAARGRSAIGTTARGIGPAYELKAARLGLRLCDLGSRALDDRLRPLFDRVARELGALGSEPSVGFDEWLAKCRAWAERLDPYLVDADVELERILESGGKILLEGAQGALLDVDHGTYPYVTSSNSTAGGASTGSGLPPHRIDGVVGVLKAYTSRVGGGPFLTEDTTKRGQYLQKRGNEFGTTTGRPRRCGWLDLVAVRYAQRLNGVDAIALTKLDVLDGIPEIPVCTAYRRNGETLTNVPARIEELEECEPIYERLPGWPAGSTAGITEAKEIPSHALAYINFIEAHLGVEVQLLSTGPRREETILRKDSQLAAILAPPK